MPGPRPLGRFLGNSQALLLRPSGWLPGRRHHPQQALPHLLLASLQELGCRAGPVRSGDAILKGGAADREVFVGDDGGVAAGLAASGLCPLLDARVPSGQLVRKC